MDDEKNKLIDALTDAISQNPQTEAIFNALLPDDDSDNNKPSENASQNTNNPIDISTILKLGQMMNGLKTLEEDDRSRLLTAIKPFLSEEKKSSVDSAIKLLKISSLLKLARELDLFKDFNF